MSFDSAFLLSCLVMYVLPALSPAGWFGAAVYPAAVPHVLPIMQIALTGPNEWL